MENADIAGMFREISDMLEARHDNIFKIRAYRKAAAGIEALAEPLEQLYRENRLGEVTGAGPAIAKKISEMVNTGKLEYYRKLKAEVSGETNEDAARPDSEGKGAR